MSNILNIVNDDITLNLGLSQGKQLSSNDYTTSDNTKLTGIETGAQVNTVNSVAGKTGAAAIHYMELFSLTDIDWKLADNSIKKISITELKMALALAIKKVGSIITSKTVIELKEL